MIQDATGKFSVYKVKKIIIFISEIVKLLKKLNGFTWGSNANVLKKKSVNEKISSVPYS